MKLIESFFLKPQNLLLLILLLFQWGLATSQVITFDLTKNQFIPDLSQVKKIKNGDFYSIQIKGINMNSYKISINKKDTFLSKALDIPVFESINLDKIKQIVYEINQNVNFQYTEGENKQSKDEEKKEFSDFILAEKDRLISYLTSLDSLKMLIDDWRFKILRSELNAKKKSPPLDEFFEYNTAVSEIELIRDKLYNLRSNSILSFSKFQNRIVNPTDKFKQDVENITKANIDLDSIINSIEDNLKLDSIYKTLLSLVYIDNNKEATYTSLPFQFNKDQEKIEITLTPWDRSLNLQTYSTILTFPTSLRNYQGVGASFYISGLYDETFSNKIEKNNDVTSYKVISEKLNKIEIGSATLLRIGQKTSTIPILGWHGSFGLGISINQKIRPRFLFGGGLTLGGTHMFALDGGFIAGYVDRLSKAVDLNQLYEKIPDRVTISQLKSSIFISIGYVYKF